MYPTIDREKTGKRIAELMDMNGLTPKDVQKYLNLTCVQTIYRWTKGINLPPVETLYALCELFNVNIDSMIVGDREFIYLKRLKNKEVDC